MRLVYIANIRLPTEKAHGLQIMKMCESFSGLEIGGEKLNIELVVPRRLNPINEDPFVYYNVSRNFKIKYLSVLDLVRLGRVGFWVTSLSFSFVSFLYILFLKPDIIYSRHDASLFFLSFLKNNIFWETHDGKNDFLIRRIVKKVGGIIAISNGLRNFYIKKGVESKKISVAPDAVDFNIFNISFSKEECRNRLHLPLNKKIILYSGHLYDWKGANLLLEAARKFQILFIFIGGTISDIADYKLKAESYKLKNIFFAGHRSHSEISLWLKAADILVLPNSARKDISYLFTSPLKLFEYMVSGTPIVASNLPSIREIVSDNDVLFFKPDDVGDLADKIKYALEHENEMMIRAGSARQKVQNYTWLKRAENILSFIIQKQEERQNYIERKSDFWRAFIIGEAIAILTIPIFKNIKFFELSFLENGLVFYFFFILWIILLPFAAAIGLFLTHQLTILRWPVIFEIGKYGLVGLLNTFMSAGIFNVFIWATGIAAGLIVDLFIFIAFVITVTHSFFWNKFWTFKANNRDGAKIEYLKFFSVTGGVAILEVFIMHILINTFGAPYGLDSKIWVNISFVFLIPFAFLGNFFGYKIFVFKNNGK